MALARPTGVSVGSAHTIPSMLLPDEVSGRRFTDIPELKRTDDVIFDTVDCFRIQSQSVGSPMTIWVDKNTFLLRRIDTKRKFDDFRTERTTIYEPVINGEISDKMLEFDPPRPD